MTLTGGTQSLSDAEIRFLLEHPQKLSEKLALAIKEGRQRDAAELVLAVGQLMLDFGEPRLALTLCTIYLGKWLASTDEPTAEILSLAGISASHVGDEKPAEQFLTRLLTLSTEQNWPSFRRRAMQSLGVLYHYQGRNEERDRLYGGALAIAIASRDELGEAQLYNNIGSVELNKGNYAESERLLLKSIGIKERLGFVLDAARSKVTLGGLLARKHEFNLAERMLKEALRVGRIYKELSLQALASYNLGNLALDRGKPEAAPRLMKTGLRLAHRAKDLRSVKLCLQGLSVVYFRSGKLKLAERYFRDLANISRQLGDAHAAAMARHDRGSMMLLLKRRRAAETEFQEAASQFKAIGDHYWQIQCIVDLAKCVETPRQVATFLRDAVVLLRSSSIIDFPVHTITDTAATLGDNDLVFELLALERSKRKKPDRRWSIRIAILGGLAGSRRHWSLAERLLLDAIAIDHRNRDYEVLGARQNDTGVAQMAQGKIADAITLFRKALQLGRRRRNRQLVSQSAHNIGEAYRRSGKPRLAKQYLREALAAATAIGDNDSRAGTLHSLGLSLLELNDLVAASNSFMKTRKTGVSLGNKFHIGQAAMGMAAIAYERAQFKKAYERYGAARNLFRTAKKESERRGAIYNMGLASMRLKKAQRASNLMMESARLASEASDWSMLSTALAGLGHLSADYGTAEQAARMIGPALMAAVVSDNSLVAYPTTLKAYLDVAMKLVLKGKTTSDAFRDAVLKHCGINKNTNALEVLIADLNEVSEAVKEFVATVAKDETRK